MARNDNDVQYNLERKLRGASQPFRFLFIDAIKKENNKEYTFNGLDGKGNPQEEDTAVEDGRSQLGSLIYGQVEIEPGFYYDPDGKRTPYDGITLDTTVITVNQTKNIVKTAISGRNGTIKEYINDGDYEVQISGILSSGINNVEPKEDIETLIGICQAMASISVGESNDFLGRLGITELVITGYSFPQKEGFRDNFFFQINAISNKPFELRIKDDI
jgi:hypothetical protein